MRKKIITAVCLVLMITLLIVSARAGTTYALPALLLILLTLVPFYASFERRRPQARELVPIAVLAAVAAVARIIFAPLPDVKPTSAVVILAGMALGPPAGFMTGATAALASNFFFGQGPFTPWQMFAWGLMGFTAGRIGRTRLGRHLPAVCVFGFIWGFLFGWIMDVYQVLGFVSPISFRSVCLTFAASFYFDLTHAGSNVVFLLCIARPWMKILTRVRRKYGLMELQ